MYADVIEDNIEKIEDNTLADSVAVDTRAEQIQGCITSAIEAACPMSYVREHSFRLSKATVALIKQKRRIRRLSQRHEDAELNTLYNNLSRQVKAAILIEKRNSWHEATASLDELNGRKLWSKFKMLSGESQSRETVTRVQDSNGNLTTNQKDTANEFAEHLAQVHRTHNGIEFCDTFRSFTEAMVTQKTADYTPMFGPIPEVGDDSPLTAQILPGEIRVALAKCKTRSSPGEDGISYSMLKHLPGKMFLVLAQLYSICLLAGYFPQCWKSAIGVMIPKPGKDKKIVSNYRPISLLSTVGKLFEKILSMRMHKHFGETQFFNPWQRAYLSKKEATEHTYRLGKMIRLAQARGWCLTAVSLDVEKAFDSVWHDGLRYKLTAIQLPAKLVRLLSSYLTERTIKVKIETELSAPVRLLAGTPQGGVLSPLLYLIYVNDVPIDPTHKCDAGQFADDLNLWAYARRKRATYLRLQRALKDLELWCSIWRIKLNAAKTQLVSFSQQRPKLELKLFGQVIKEQSEMKLLGVTFDKGLSFKSHINERCKKATQRVALLKRLRGKNWGASSRTLLNLYKQYVRPVLETGYDCTADASKTQLNRLQVVQNSALRAALGLPFRTRIATLHRLARMDPIPKRLRKLQINAVKRFAASHLMVSLQTQTLLLE
jgi:hypothetical protein